MKTFREFLEESLNRPYPIKFHGKDVDWSGSMHEYHFQDHRGETHPIRFIHYDEAPHEAEVHFSSPEGGYQATGKQGHHAIRIFSTMRDAIEKHAKKHPKLKKITFGSDKNKKDRYDYEEGSRNKLYRKLTHMAGGKTIDDGEKLTHAIPVNKAKKIK